MASATKVSILDYFNIVFEGENGKIESNCKYCGTRIQAKRSVTSNFVTHLKRKHPTMYEEFVKRKDMKREGYSSSSMHNFTNAGNVRYTVPIITGAAAGGAAGGIGRPGSVGVVGATSGGRLTKFDKHDPRQVLISEAVAKMIVQDLQPVSMVEKEGFRALLQLLEPRYTPDSQHYIQSQLLPAYAYQAQLATRQALASAHTLSLSLDICKDSTPSASGYFGITCHFLTCDWQMRSALLACLLLTDVTSCSQILSDFEEVCFSHSVAGRAFRVVSDAIPSPASSFYHYITSAVPAEKLNQVFDTTGLTSGSVSSALSEWAVQLKVLHRLLESVDFLEELSGPSELSLGTSEKVLLRELIDILEPFTEAWEMVHGPRQTDPLTDRHVPISLAMPCVLGLCKHLSETSAVHCPGLLVGLRQAVDKLLSPLLQDPLYITATTLDPQFKLTWSNNQDWHRQVILEEINKLSNSTNPTDSTTDIPAGYPSPPAPALSPVSPLSRPCRLFSFIKQRPMTQAKSLEQELVAYLREEPTDEDALHYWRRKSIDFPQLAQMAKKVFTIPACGTVVESIFSAARCCQRTCDLPKYLETLIYLKANYKLLWA
uniref:BED-type domain-containing protein n=1 Tax=Knipowitschia caucasica TaxID=637954 RepID=A0AAV2LYW2_KNICA